MANAGKPPKKKTFKTPPEEPTQASVLTKKPANKQVPLNFTVENEFRRDFKTFAAQHDIPMVDLLRTCFQTYKEQSQV